MIQRRAARFVTNRYHNTSSVSNMIQHLNWRSLAHRRSDTRLIMLYKINYSLVAITKTDRLIPPLRQSRNIHSLSFQIPQCRLQVRQQSFFPRTIKLWNSIPMNIVMSDSVESFKTAISTYTYSH